MKTKLIFLLVFAAFSVSAQFPAPQDFQFSFVYYTCNQSGYCNGVMVNGPAYCSDFWWDAPDSSRTTSLLDHYRVYYLDYFNMDTSVIATTQELQVEMLIGIIGQVWVTAVYSDPDGESLPSNIVVNDDLPITIPENELARKRLFYYDQQSQLIHFTSPGDIKEIKVTDIQGRMLISAFYPKNNFTLQELGHGVYFIEMTSDQSESCRQKIIR